MHPSGTVWLLFTDVEGSTQRWERYRDAMGEALRRHDEVVRAAIESYGGYVFKTIGDAFCAAFSRPEDVAKAATSAVRALEAQGFSAVGGLSVRVAIHCGQCEERDGDYFGPAVNRIARLLAIGNGGQVLVSEAAAHLLRDHLPAECSLIEAGLHRLKDLGNPERVWLLHAPDFAGTFKPLRSLSAFANNLPTFLFPIIGRTRELADVQSLLDEYRLVSIVGAGGIGKTRVAVQVAAARLDETESNGVWFVDLAPISDSELVGAAIVSAVGAQALPGRDADAALTAALRSWRATIVLDNCEHVVAEAARVVELLVRSCPQLRVLATSREALGVPGERVYRLDTLDDQSAVDLFVARAGQADQRFAAERADRAVISQVCLRLDRIALAIELAAARVNVVSPLEMLGRLGERLKLLSAGSRTALPRQQTLRALIDWSYDLLSETERHVFRALCVFSGGFTLEAASSVLERTLGSPADAVECVSALLEKSMLASDQQATRRFRMLESVREYARERLEQAGEIELAHRAHASYYARFAEEAAGRWGDVSQIPWMARYGVEFDNLCAAAEWASLNDPAVAAQIIANMIDLWFYNGMVAAGIERTEKTLRALGSEDSEQTLAVWLALGELARGSREFRRGLAAGERALSIARRAGNAAAAAHALQIVGWSRWELGREREQAVGELEQAARELETTGPRLDAVLARADYAIGLSLYDAGAARQVLEDALIAARAYDWPISTLRIEVNLAEVEFICGRIDAAIAQARRAIELSKKMGHIFPLMLSMGNLASYLGIAGHNDESIAVASDVLAMAREHGSTAVAAIVMQNFALRHAMFGDSHVAARLLGYVDAYFDEGRAEREPLEAAIKERILTALRGRLDEPALRRELAAGRTLGGDAACALAVGGI